MCLLLVGDSGHKQHIAGKVAILYWGPETMSIREPPLQHIPLVTMTETTAVNSDKPAAGRPALTLTPSRSSGAPPPHAPAVRLPLQPQGRRTAAVIGGGVESIVLHVRLPGDGDACESTDPTTTRRRDCRRRR